MILSNEYINKFKYKQFTDEDIIYLFDIIYNINFSEFDIIMRNVMNLTFDIYKSLPKWFIKLTKSCYNCNKTIKIYKNNDIVIYECNICDIKYDFTNKEINNKNLLSDLYDFIKNN